jgi:lipoprotein NlpD
LEHRRLSNFRSLVVWLGTAGLGLAAGCVSPYSGIVRHAEGIAPGHAEPELVRPSNGNSAVVRHRVGEGENLYRISLRYGVTPDAIARANGINDVRSLRVGQELVIPSGVRSEEVSSATASLVVSSSSVRPEADEGPRGSGDEERRGPPRQGRGMPPLSRESFGKGNLEWPLRGVLYGRYGRRGREVHDGIDLAAPLGTPVQTAAPGLVLFAGEQRGYGLIVVVEHKDGLVTLYAHNRDLRVKSGQKVREGQVLSTVGESGKTSGPHLHFEVREHGKAVDPLPKLGPAPRG